MAGTTVTLVVDAFKEHLCLSQVAKEMKWRYSWKDGIRRGVLPIMRHWHETDDDPGLLHMLDSVIARYEHTVMDTSPGVVELIRFFLERTKPDHLVLDVGWHRVSARLLLSLGSAPEATPPARSGSSLSTQAAASSSASSPAPAATSAASPPRRRNRQVQRLQVKAAMPSLCC